MIQPTTYRPWHNASSSSQPKPQAEAEGPADTVMIGNYNVKNWFAPEDADPSIGKRVKPQGELGNLADNIEKSGVEVLTMQEVGTSLKNVKKFFDQELPGKFPYIAYQDTNDHRGVHVVVASKYPITNVVSHTDARFPLGDGTGQTKFSRDLLRADIDVKGIPVTVYTTHAKSRRTYSPNDKAHPGGEDPNNQRIGEGKAAGQIVRNEMKAFPGRLYVVTGDLNDGTEDPSVQAIMHPSQGEQMFDTLEGRSEADRRTWPADPRKGHGFGSEQFDHILVPESQRSKVIDTHIVDIPGTSQRASDHLEVVSTFNLKA